MLVDTFTGSPVCSIYLWVDAGSADEGPGQSGAAHFVEHMLFKGTAQRPLEGLAGFVEGLGGDINAYTTYERTVLHATVPSEFWEQTLEILVDMALNPVFDAEEIEREREVILEEIRGGDDDPASTLADQVAGRVFTKHPYGRPVIGSTTSVRQMTRQALMDFHESAYSAGNLLISVSGPVQAAQVQAAVDALVPAQALPPRRPRPVEPPQGRARSVVVEGRFDEPLIEVGFRGVDALDPAAPALDLLMVCLAGSPASVLGERLQLAGLATDTWGICETERDPGLLLLGCAPLQGKSLACATEIGKVLAELVAGEGLNAAGLQRAKAQILSERRFLSETVDGRAHDQVWYAAMAGDVDQALAYQARIAACTLEELRAVASMLHPSGATLGVLSPEKVDAKALRAALRAPVFKPRAKGPALHCHTLSNGLRVVVEPRHVGVVALRVAALGGQLAESPSSAGVSDLWSRAVGAPGLSPLQLAERLDLTGGALGGFAGRQSMGLRCELPPEQLDLGLELIAAMLIQPQFPPDEVRRVLAEMVHERSIQQDDPAACAVQVLRKTLLAPHPSGMPFGGSKASLARLGIATLRRLHSTCVNPARMVVSIAGGVDPERALARIEQLFGGLKGKKELPKVASPVAEGHQEARLELEREQAHVLMGWKGLPLYHPQSAALGLASACLNGQGGRLFMDLREKRGWAYQVGAGSEEGLHHGVFTAHIAVAPELAAKARDGLEMVLRTLADQGPSKEELAKAKRFLLGGRAMSRQRSGARAMEWGHAWLYGEHPIGGMERADQRIQDCSAEQVQAALSSTLSGPSVVVFAGGLS